MLVEWDIFLKEIQNEAIWRKPVYSICFLKLSSGFGWLADEMDAEVCLWQEVSMSGDEKME